MARTHLALYLSHYVPEPAHRHPHVHASHHSFIYLSLALPSGEEIIHRQSMNLKLVLLCSKLLWSSSYLVRLQDFTSSKHIQNHPCIFYGGIIDTHFYFSFHNQQEAIYEILSSFYKQNKSEIKYLMYHRVRSKVLDSSGTKARLLSVLMNVCRSRCAD